jgi:hypothetical protein
MSSKIINVLHSCPASRYIGNSASFTAVKKGFFGFRLRLSGCVTVERIGKQYISFLAKGEGNERMVGKEVPRRERMEIIAANECAKSRIATSGCT